jgi:hypothetical protein
LIWRGRGIIELRGQRHSHIDHGAKIAEIQGGKTAFEIERPFFGIVLQPWLSDGLDVLLLGLGECPFQAVFRTDAGFGRMVAFGLWSCKEVTLPLEGLDLALVIIHLGFG